MKAKYGPITFISSDAGTQFEKSNFLGNSDEKRLFQQLEGVHTAKPRSQWQNFVETSIKKFKKLIKTCFR